MSEQFRQERCLPCVPVNSADVQHERATPIAYAMVDLRWGEAAVALTSRHLDLLRLCDGTKTGRELMKGAPDWTEEGLASALIGLRRTCIVEMR